MTGSHRHRQIRVIVAEDSPTARHLLVELLCEDPDIEVVGQASHGLEALELTRRLRPDLVVMDIRMPVMDGFEATRQIMIEAPTPVVIVTAAGLPDVELGLRAVELGALSLLPKPTGPTDPKFAAEAHRLVSLVKALSEVKVIRRHRPAGARPNGAGRPWQRAEVVAVAASTGGPAALHRLLGCLSRGATPPFLVVQHISDGFTAGLAAFLRSGTSLSVKVAEHGEPVTPGVVYLAAENRHLEVSPQHTIQLSSGPPVGGFRPAATVLFRSVAASYGAGAVAVVLTGMGSDGCDGAQAVKGAGGRVLAQDEATSVVFGMPGAVVAAGLTDVVGPIEALADRCSWARPGGIG